MPVETKLIANKVRVVDPSGKVDVNDKGTPRDGGGQANTPAGWAKAERQIGYINAGEAKKLDTVVEKKPLPGAASRKKSLPKPRTILKPRPM